MHCYLKDRKYRTEIISSFNNFIDLLKGAPEGSILWSPLFNIYICDLLIEGENVTSYADDMNPYSNSDNFVNFIDDIETKRKI